MIQPPPSRNQAATLGRSRGHPFATLLVAYESLTGRLRVAYESLWGRWDPKATPAPQNRGRTTTEPQPKRGRRCTNAAELRLNYCRRTHPLRVGNPLATLSVPSGLALLPTSAAAVPAMRPNFGRGAGELWVNYG